MKSKKMSNFYKISTFSYFSIDLWRYFYTQICKTGYHSKACGIGRAMKVTASRLLNYTGHSGPKTEFRGQKSKIVSENRKSIFRSKQMPISVIMGPNESKKIGRYSGTKWLLHSVIMLFFILVKELDDQKSRWCIRVCFKFQCKNEY